jgi:hypothetical protein
VQTATLADCCEDIVERLPDCTQRHQHGHEQTCAANRLERLAAVVLDQAQQRPHDFGKLNPSPR